MRRPPTQIVSRGADETRLSDAERAFLHFRTLLPPSRQAHGELIEWNDLPPDLKEVVGHVVEHIQQSVQIRINQRRRPPLLRCAVCRGTHPVLVGADGNLRCERCGDFLREI